MRYIFIIILLFGVNLPSQTNAQERIELRTCKIGNVIYTEDSRGTKCIPPLTPERIRLLADILKATAPPRVSEEFSRNQRFCMLYQERKDVPNQLKYCGALSEMGSVGATEILCARHFDIDFRSQETLRYCSKTSDADRIMGHFYMAQLHLNNKDYVAATAYFYRGVERSFFYNGRPTKQDTAFGPPSNELSKMLTEAYLIYAAQNLYGASLASLGFPEIQIEGSMELSDRAERSTIVNDWIGLVDYYPLQNVNVPMKVGFVIFTVPAGRTHQNIDGRIIITNDAAKPVYCFLKDESGVILLGDLARDEHVAACGYLATHGKFVAAVDINGNYAPSFVYGNAEIRKGKVVLVN